jgi:hypothetical protein
MGKKPMEFYEGDEAAKRFDAGMSQFLNYKPLPKAAAKTPKPAPQARSQSVNDKPNSGR